MKKYELLLVLPGTLDENETAQKTGEILEIIKEFGQNADLKEMGKNRLAYPIKQVRYGYFFTVHFETEPEKVKAIEEKLRLTRGLLRATIYLYNKALEGAEKIYYFSQTSTLAEPEAVKGASQPAERVEVVAEVKEEPAGEVAAETAVEPAGEKVEEKKPRAPKAQKIDLKEIDKKLDEILSDEDINI